MMVREAHLVVGASGFVGSETVRQLNSRKFVTLGLGRKTLKDLPTNRQKNLVDSTYLAVDLDEPCDNICDVLNDALIQLDASLGSTIHLAWSGADKLSDESVVWQFRNVKRTLRLYECIRRLGGRRFVFGGSMEEAFATAYTKETADLPRGAWNRHLIYALAKQAARELLLAQWCEGDPELVLASSSHVMGPGDDKDSFLQVAVRTLMDSADLRMTSGEQGFDVVDVHDVASAYIELALAPGLRSEYWIGSGAPQTLRQYVERAKAELSSASEVVYGAVDFADAALSESTFSTGDLLRDTEFAPIFSYEESVRRLAHGMTIDG